jgi:hypothetical protein
MTGATFLLSKRRRLVVVEETANGMWRAVSAEFEFHSGSLSACLERIEEELGPISIHDCIDAQVRQ